MTHTSHTAYKLLSDLVLLTLAIALIFGVLLGGRPYSAPSESRYIEIGREMAESGNFVTPRLNYVKYFEKPPLFYWVQAAWSRIAGDDFFAARVPTAFFSLLLCLQTYLLARMLYGRRAGILAALMMATCIYSFALSRIVLLDVPVSMFLVGTLSAFLYVVNAPPGAKRTCMLYIMYAMAAGAMMTKGLIGVVLPGAVIFLWFACTGKWTLLRQMRLPSGTLLFLLLTLPWHILVWQHNPEHPQFYFIHEHWERYTTKVHGRYHPFWFFGAVLAGGLFPWLFFAPQALRSGLAGSWKERRQDSNRLFLLLWIGFIFLFFSASDSKLIPYILPIFPPLMALMGRYFACLWEEIPPSGRKRNGFGPGVLLMAVMLIGLAAAPLAMGAYLDPQSKLAATLAQGGDDVTRLSIAALVSVIVLFVTYVQGRARHVIVILVAVAAMLMQMGDLVAANYSKDSMQEFAGVIKSLAQPGDEVASYDSYYQDLPIYLERRITVVHWKGELEFGTKHEDTSAWMIEYPEFWKRWLDPNRRMFVVMREDAYERIKAEGGSMDDKHLYMMLQIGRNVLFSNIPVKTLLEKSQK